MQEKKYKFYSSSSSSSSSSSKPKKIQSLKVKLKNLVQRLTPQICRNISLRNYIQKTLTLDRQTDPFIYSLPPAKFRKLFRNRYQVELLVSSSRGGKFSITMSKNFSKSKRRWTETIELNVIERQKEVPESGQKTPHLDL